MAWNGTPNIMLKRPKYLLPMSHHVGILTLRLQSKCCLYYIYMCVCYAMFLFLLLCNNETQLVVPLKKKNLVN